MGLHIGGAPVRGGTEVAVHMVYGHRVAICRHRDLAGAVEAIGGLDPVGTMESVPAHVPGVAGVGKSGPVKGAQDFQEGQQEGKHHQGQAEQHRQGIAAFIPPPVGQPKQQLDQEHRETGGQGRANRWFRVTSL